MHMASHQTNTYLVGIAQLMERDVQGLCYKCKHWGVIHDLEHRVTEVDASDQRKNGGIFQFSRPCRTVPPVSIIIPFVGCQGRLRKRTLHAVACQELGAS